jgi:hypothetical protein
MVKSGDLRWKESGRTHESAFIHIRPPGSLTPRMDGNISMWRSMRGSSLAPRDSLVGLLPFSKGVGVAPLATPNLRKIRKGRSEKQQPVRSSS